MGTMRDENRPSQTLGGTEVKSMTTATPFPTLSASDLRGLAAFFAAEPAAVSVNIDRDGVTLVVTRRDLAFIHSLDASRFGQSAECPLCEVG
jgi:hypothetical protein